MKNNEKTLFILGPKSIMIDDIEEVLKDLELTYVYGFSNCERTTNHDKHLITSVSKVTAVKGKDTVVCIDCALSKSAVERWYKNCDIISNISDETDSSDKDYEHYWKNSVLGKTYTLLGKHPNKHARMIAAGEYCLRQAYSGLCVSIDSNEFKEHRVSILANELNLDVTNVNDILEESLKQVLMTKTIIIGGIEFKDIRTMKIPLIDEVVHMIDTPVLRARMDNKSGNKYNYITNASVKDIDTWCDSVKDTLVCIKKNYYSSTAEGVRL